MAIFKVHKGKHYLHYPKRLFPCLIVIFLISSSINCRRPSNEGDGIVTVGERHGGQSSPVIIGDQLSREFIEEMIESPEIVFDEPEIYSVLRTISVTLEQEKHFQGEYPIFEVFSCSILPLFNNSSSKVGVFVIEYTYETNGDEYEIKMVVDHGCQRSFSQVFMKNGDVFYSECNVPNNYKMENIAWGRYEIQLLNKELPGALILP